MMLSGVALILAERKPHLREWRRPGSAPFAGGDGIRFVNAEVSRKNREARRPFIEHQIEIVNFQVALQRAVTKHPGVRFISPTEIKAASRQPIQASRSPFDLRAKVANRGG